MIDDIQVNSELLDVSIEAAIRAGKNATRMKNKVKTNYKNNNTMVTKADKKSEEIAREVLSESDLIGSIVGEEYGGDVNSSRYAIIDPIDGTTNYAFENPIYGSAIGIVEEGEVICGVFYMPEMDYLFYAVEGEGAYRNAEKLEIKGNKPEDKLLGVTGKRKELFVPYLDLENNGIRQLGSAVAVQCWIASEWLTGGVIGALAPWDMVVGQIMMTESGGVMKNVENRKTDWDSIKRGRVVVGEEKTVDNIINQMSDECLTGIIQSDYNLSQ